MSEESKNILIENLSFREYTKVTKDISKLEEENKYQKEMYEEYCDKHTKLMNEYNNLQEENIRLNNIINELEKLINEYELGKYDYSIPVFILKDKLKELKGND